MKPDTTKCNPCVDCGNDFIECFGEKRKWWVGCKPCSKRDGGKDHMKCSSREKAIAKWNACNPEHLDD